MSSPRPHPPRREVEAIACVMDASTLRCQGLGPEASPACACCMRGAQDVRLLFGSVSPQR